MALELGVHVQIFDQGIMLYLSDDDTKNHRHYSVPCSAEVEPYMRKYLDVYRPMLLRGGEYDRLWITHMGTPMTEVGFYGELRKVTLKKLGIALNPHSFRDSLATGIILENSANVPHAAALLGHSSLDTTNSHYNQAPAQAAYGRYQAILDSLRDPDDEEDPQPCVP